MKYLVLSDIHGSLYYTKKVTEQIEKESPDKIILLGDLYYHGPRNPLPRDYNTMEVAKILNGLKDKIICIRGNCDAQVDEMISDFKFKESSTLNIAGKKFFFTHGHKYNKDNLPNIKIDVIVYGHFHTGFIQKIENSGILAVNAGSISLPKNNTKNSYLIIEKNMIYLKDILGQVIEKTEF